VVLALSLTIRVAAFAELSRGPFLSLEQWTETDMHYYDTWGRAIAQGNWLSQGIGVPMHEWQTALGNGCLATFPQGATPADVWRDWIGPRSFYDDALYSYLIGITYRVVGDNPHAVIAWQLVIGALSNVLILLIAWRYFGALVGAVAGVLAVLCAPLLHYELLLLRDSLVVFAGLGVVWLAGNVEQRPAVANWAVFGLACGFAMLLKTTLLALCVPLAAGLVIVGPRRAGVGQDRSQQRLRYVTAMLAGFAVAAAILVLRNGLAGGPLYVTSGNGAITFVSSNNVAYPNAGGFSIDIQKVGAIMCATQGHFVSAAVKTLGAHTSGSLLSLFWHKFDHVWFWYEMPNNANFYYLRLHSAVLSWLPLTFFAVAPLGLVGLVLAFGDRRRIWPLLMLVAWIVGILVVFLVLGRLRAVLIAGMIPFAALALVQIARRTRRWPAITAVVVLTLWTGRALPAGVPLISVTDWFTPYWVTYEAQTNALTDHGDSGGAARALEEFLQYEPDFSNMDRSKGQLVDAGDRDAARAFAKMHAECADLFERSGQLTSADAERAKSLSLLRLSGTPAYR
jgi:4-amino-4-deoxy-L-arabinose transferase-like glycosyltransferase